jgi:hypothetical protein
MKRLCRICQFASQEEVVNQQIILCVLVAYLI